MTLLQLGLCLVFLSVVASESASKATFAKRVLQGDVWEPDRIRRRLVFQKHPTFRRRHSSLVVHPSERRDQDFSKEENCDQALLSCLPEDECADCFRFLYSEDIDWGRVTPETSCEETLGFLAEKDYCKDMHDDQASKDAFCNSFDACAVWEEGETDDGEARIDCDALTECDWDGMHKSFIGDGICHDSMGECYNTAICNYDGGDCCEDTCEKTTYVECGHDGYACRNPNSTACDPLYTLGCENNANIPDENNPDPADTKCKDDEVKYRLVMYDSFGDGWDQTKMTISPTNKKSDIKYNGGIETGSTGSRYICLPSASTCIHVEVSGGEWGNEASWEIKPMTKGAPSLGGGGAPMSCDFPVGGQACDKTCDGKANLTPNNDPEYKAFKDMYTCIENKCAIQVGVCEADETCSTCLSEEKADFCYGSDAFLSVVDCTMCRCTARQDSDFCHQKLNPGMQPVNPTGEATGRQPDGSPRACSPQETMKGSNAVLTFAQCSKFDQVKMLVTSYDENKFGMLDQFEKCAHSFVGTDDHGGHTALGCMQILVNAMSNGGDDETVDDESAEAIASLAELLYHNAGGFCECAASASADCPLCSSFIHMKTLLYESLDACQSLDEIDCDAWFEFHKPCKNNFVAKFGEVDFSKDEACEFVHNGCGGAGPFPAFRRLDCGDEADTSNKETAWEFYQKYSSACLNDDNSQPIPPGKDTPAPTVAPPTPPPTGAPVPKPPPTPPPTPKPYKPYVPSGGGSGGDSKPYVPPSGGDSKPYVPPDGDNSESSYKSPENTKASHGWRNFFIIFVVGAVGFVYYKRRTDAFSFVRYRNTRNYAGGESEMYSAPYSGLTMDSGSGAFQPPSLPPTPSAIDGQMM